MNRVQVTGRQFLFKIGKTLGVSSQMVAELLGPHGHTYVRLRSSVTVLVQWAELCLQQLFQAISDFCRKGFLFRHCLPYCLQMTTPRKSLRHLAYLPFPRGMLIHFLYTFLYWGELFCYNCWYLCKGTITKYISLCVLRLRECGRWVTKLLGRGQSYWPGKTWIINS